MADKSFGVKDVNLIGASGTPTIDSPNNLNINAVNVAISTDMSIGGNLTVTGSISGGGAIPSGVIMLWSGASNAIPTGYVLCDGNNSTPDLRNKFVVGAHNVTGEGSWPSVGVGSTGGSADAVVVEHNHGITEPQDNNGNIGHRHVYTAATKISGYTDNGGAPDERSTTKTNLNTNYSTTGITINNQGESGTNKNLPPYYALCYIMKT